MLPPFIAVEGAFGGVEVLATRLHGVGRSELQNLERLLIWNTFFGEPNGAAARGIFCDFALIFCTIPSTVIMASLRLAALALAMASLPSNPQLPVQEVGLVLSDDEEEALDLEPAHYKAKFEWLDKHGHVFGAHAAAAGAWL